MSLASEPLLICRVAAGKLAIPAGAVAAVLPVLPLWRPPTLPRPVAGFAAIMGATVAVLHPDMLFDPEAELPAIDLYAHFVRLRGVAAQDVCLLVSRAEEMVTPMDEDIRRLASNSAHNGCVVAEVRLGDEVAHMIAVDRLLDQSEQVKLESLTRLAERRAGIWADHA